MCSLLPPCVLLCVSLVLRARDCEWSDRSRDCWTDHLGGRRFLHAGAYHHLLHSGAQQRLVLILVLSCCTSLLFTLAQHPTQLAPMYAFHHCASHHIQSCCGRGSRGFSCIQRWRRLTLLPGFRACSICGLESQSQGLSGFLSASLKSASLKGQHMGSACSW